MTTINIVQAIDLIIHQLVLVKCQLQGNLQQICKINRLIM
jgi:hypothetical protein